MRKKRNPSLKSDCEQKYFREWPLGFTLIELLLGLVIFSIISVTLYSTFSQGLRLNKSSMASNSIYREARWTVALLTKDIANMVPYDGSTSYPEQKMFLGEKDRIEFLSSTDKGLKVVKYYLMENPTAEVRSTLIGSTFDRNVNVDVRKEVVFDQVVPLIREEVDFKKYLEDEDAKGEIEVIAGEVLRDSLGFQYGYSRSESELEDVEFRDTWVSAGIPQWVELSLTFVFVENPGETIPVRKTIFIPYGELGKNEI